MNIAFGGTSDWDVYLAWKDPDSALTSGTAYRKHRSRD